MNKNCRDEKSVNFIGKFVVPNTKDTELGWYFAVILGLAEDNKYVLYLWDQVPKVIRKTCFVVEETFSIFDDEQDARACFKLKKLATSVNVSA